MIVILVTAVTGVISMLQGAAQGVALVLSAGLLGAIYARLVLKWHPGADESGPVSQSTTELLAGEDAGEPRRSAAESEDSRTE